MNVWSVDIEPTAEHQGTASSAYMIPKESLQPNTEGTYLGLVSVFTVEAGQQLVPHQHPTHEFWFVLEGSGLVQVADETRRINTGDLIYTEPDTPHAVTADPGSRLRAFCFALSYPGRGSQHIDVELPPVVREL